MVKSAVFLGLGSDNVVRVATDDKGRMKPDELEKLILADKAKVLFFNLVVHLSQNKPGC